MGMGILLSGLLHLFLILFVILGLPNWRSKDLPEPPRPIPIEIINISDLSVAPSPKKSQEEKPKNIPKPKPEPEPEPEPEPKPETKSEPQPEAKPVPEEKKPEPEPVKEEVVDTKPDPIPEPKPEPKKPEKKKPEKKEPEKKEAEKKTEKKKEKKPEKKKEPPKKEKKDLFDDIEKAVNDLSEESKERQPDRGDLVEKAQPNEATIVGEELSISELDALKRQLSQCWSPPAGMKDAETMVVDLKVSLLPDGTVSEVNIVDMSRYQSDNQFKPAADAARRAVLNPACNPLKIPADKYEQLKSFTLKFDPREMF